MKMVKKESPKEQGVSKGLWNGEEGRMEENAVAGVEKAGEEAASSQLGSCSVAGQSSRSNSVLFGGDSSSAELLKNTAFSLTFAKSRKLRSPRQVENLRAERSSNAKKILNAERSSNASSASLLGGSTLDHGSRPAGSPTVHW